MSRSGDPLGDLLGDWVEPWMEVLLVGLSAELLPRERTPTRLSTMRPGGRLPGGAWDAVCLRWEDDPAASAGGLLPALQNLRAGGFALVVGAPADASHALQLPDGTRLELARSGDGFVVVRRTAAGSCDLVGLRRALATLSDHVVAVEALAETSSIEAPELVERLGQLGDLDRESFLPWALAESEPPLSLPHGRRSLIEQVVRFRHLRTRSIDLARDLAPERWNETVPALGLTRAQWLRAWAEREAREIQALSTRS